MGYDVSTGRCWCLLGGVGRRPFQVLSGGAGSFLQSSEVLGRHWLPPFSGFSAGPGSVFQSSEGLVALAYFRASALGELAYSRWHLTYDIRNDPVTNDCKRQPMAKKQPINKYKQVLVDREREPKEQPHHRRINLVIGDIVDPSRYNAAFYCKHKVVIPCKVLDIEHDDKNPYYTKVLVETVDGKLWLGQNWLKWEGKRKA